MAEVDNINEQEKIRREKLAVMQQEGRDPFAITKYDVTDHSEDAKAKFEKKDEELKATITETDEEAFAEKLKELHENDKIEVSVAGRMLLKRVMGKASFATINDLKGNIQIYVTRDALGVDDYQAFKKYDIGDIIGIKGFAFITQTGQLSVHVKELTVLSKSLRVLPIVKTDAEGNVYDGFSDPELRYRQRYVDLIVNPQVRDVFVQRAKIIATMRDYFNEAGCLEVETPILQSIPGGATARPFITHHNALDIDLYMRIANELYLKRLIVGGYSGVYEFAKDFRNEGMDKTHNPEFTCMEIYVAYKDYIWMMEFVEKMLEKIALKLHGTTKVKIGENEIDFKAGYRRLPILEAIKDYAGVDIAGMDADQLRETCKKLNVEFDESMGEGKLIDAIFGTYCEDHLIEPTFITDYPVAMSPLTKRHRNDPTLTERFELFVCGKELCNAYSELNDPIDQLERFEEQAALKSHGDDEAMFIDYDFVRALEYGMPPTAGWGMGIDRLTMLLTDEPSIREVLLFPLLRPEA